MTLAQGTTLIQVGLVDKTGKLDADLVRSAAAALNVQVTRRSAPVLGRPHTVIFLPDPEKIPTGVWPVFLVDHLPPGEGGFHLNKHNQPYAKVIATPKSEDWTVDASHETIEMLVDPFGNRVQASRSIEINGDTIQDGTSEFQYLVEACDPCEADKFAYRVQGFPLGLSDSPFLRSHRRRRHALQLHRGDRTATPDPEGGLHLVRQRRPRRGPADPVGRSRPAAAAQNLGHGTGQ